MRLGLTRRFLSELHQNTRKVTKTKSFFFTALTAGALASVAARTDSGVPGACSDVITTVTNKTVYVDVTSTQSDSPRETNPANCARSLTAKPESVDGRSLVIGV
jgi:hypothetical protein